MKRIRFIMAVLREHDAGTNTADLSRKHGISEVTLNESLFVDLDQARRLIGAWVADYNTTRPHSSLGYKTPAAYAGTLIAPKGATSAKALAAG